MLLDAPSTVPGQQKSLKTAGYDEKSSLLESFPPVIANNSAPVDDDEQVVRSLNWARIFALILLPIYGFALVPSTPLRLSTAIWAVVYYAITGLGITAGYHRLWAHTSYSATLPLRILLAAAGGGALQSSIRWWARQHRAHHRYTDTNKDPYSVNKGFWWAHIGWLLFHQDVKKIGRVDISDLNQDPVVIWQHRHFLLVQFVMGLVFPTVVAGACWGDWWGGLVYAAIIRVFCVHQATFCVNSLAHWLGENTFDDRHTPKDHFVTALVTFGEGYHNFHHTFPSDYRNAIQWYQYDPTKWVIWCWKRMGLAYDLKKFRSSAIEKTRLTQEQKMLDLQQSELQSRKAQYDWGPAIESLPIYTWDQYIKSTREEGARWILIAGVIHDVSTFGDEHPGGKILLDAAVGKDATAMFNGGIYSHSATAREMLSTMRIGVVRNGGEVEVEKGC